MSTYTTYPGTLYNYTAGVLCGVLITEPVMRKLVRLQTKHLEDVKRLLTDENERGNVFPSMWTLHYPNGEQTTVEYIATNYTAQQRINSAVVSHPPTACFPVFIAGSMDEAKEMADNRFKEMVE
jgi:hypothetical protein